MSDNQKKVLLSALFLAVAFLLFRPYFTNDVAAEPGIPVREMLDVAFAMESPVAVVFSYGAECCPSTEQFFQMYEIRVGALLRARSEIKGVWLNVGAESQADQDAILSLAERYGVTQVPSLIILDKDQQLVALLQGEPDYGAMEEELDKVLGR